MPSRFVADVHLSAAHPARTALFLRFLETQAPYSAALYLLGDIFDVWLGDDDTSQLAQTVIAALWRLTGTGTSVFYLHGNRDFLLGAQFLAATGVQLVPDPVLLDLHGIATLLTHGDQLCTDDLAYQAFRQQVRAPAWQQHFLARPLAERLAIAQGYRADSQREQRAKPDIILDVNPDAVRQLFAAHPAALRLIHGHTHRPAAHVLTLAAGRTATRYVLPAWEDALGGALCVTDERLWLESLA
jgi:UDP-2,3-diacylglucosamine hydrolase